MWKTFIFLFCLVSLSISSACSTIQATEIPTQPNVEDQPQVDLSATATKKMKPTPPFQASTPPPAEILLPFQPVREYIAQVLDIPLEEVKLISHEPEDWPDTCLGAPRPGEICAEVITPGWEVVFNTPAGVIRAHLDKSGRFYRLVPPLESGDTSTPKPSPQLPSSGIEGTITIGPACPGPVKVGQPCPDQPYQATIRVLSEDRAPIAQTDSGTDGYFRIVLPPGTYILHPEASGPFPRAGDQIIVVQEGEFSQVEVRYDSGMR